MGDCNFTYKANGQKVLRKSARLKAQAFVEHLDTYSALTAELKFFKQERKRLNK